MILSVQKWREYRRYDRFGIRLCSECACEIQKKKKRNIEFIFLSFHTVYVHSKFSGSTLENRKKNNLRRKSRERFYKSYAVALPNSNSLDVFLVYRFLRKQYT